jgi:hypothetical protein
MRSKKGFANASGPLFSVLLLVNVADPLLMALDGLLVALDLLLVEADFVVQVLLQLAQLRLLL